MSSSSDQAAASSEDHSPTPITSKKCDYSNVKGLVVVYKECLKNHAASLGGNATDGCGEFMPSSQDNLHCSACGCHRNFHHKEVHVGGDNIGRGYSPQCPYWSTTTSTPTHQMKAEYHQGKGLLRARAGPYDFASPSVGLTITCPKVEKVEEHEEKAKILLEGIQSSKKRCRTRFTNEQKEKMLRFAEKAGWKIQKLEEGLVRQFCQEVGIMRRVLKVWMHNNKNHFGGKNCATNDPATTIGNTDDSSDK